MDTEFFCVITPVNLTWTVLPLTAMGVRLGSVKLDPKSIGIFKILSDFLLKNMQSGDAAEYR